LFPYLPGNPELRATRFMLLFETADMPARRAPQADQCCCPEHDAFGSHVVTFQNCTDPSRRGEAQHIVCRAAEQWPRLYSGMTDVDLLPFRRNRESCEVRFGFADEIGEIVHAYLFCRYEPVHECKTAAARHAARPTKPATRGGRSIPNADVLV
jgi:hypothetical protein